MKNKKHPWWDFYIRKLVYALFLVLLFFSKISVKLYSTIFYRKNKNFDKPKSIAAIWYWPYDFPSASYTRLGKWEEFFEKEGIKFDNFYVGSMKEKVEEYEAGNWTQRYWFYTKTLFKRTFQFFKLKNYDVVWIDRWYLPYYPSKTAFWENNIKKITTKLIVDSTDGYDYENNPKLIMDIFNVSDRITVAYEGLYNFYKPKFPEKVFRFNYTIVEDNYKIKENWKLNDSLPIIGWMGSPGNFEFVKDIEEELQKVASEIPFKFLIICRQDVEINIPNAQIEYHRYGADYESLLQSFDIGISPFTVNNFGNSGKIGMKHQEFLLCQIPQVCSPIGISEHAEHNKHCLIANEIKDWSHQLVTLLRDEDLRKNLALEGRKLCLEHYTFQGQWPLTQEALTKF